MDWTPAMLALAIGLGMAIAASIGALSQSRAIWRAVEAIARQPEAGGRIFTSMIIGLALIETLVLYTLLIAILLNGSLGDVIKAKYGKESLENQKLVDTYKAEKEAKEKGK
ncbi:MAG: ATP synthase F0 subunit C [Planctomycetes bacterium]|nr:ATP synthase F0 subunit C [Planctomycetota bacterium]